MRRTTTILLALLVPTALAAQRPDSTQKHGARAETAARGRHVNTAAGSVAAGARIRGSARRASGRSMGLTTAQVAQLQAALQREGCDPGPIDGVMGSRTRSALPCARRKLNVAGDDTNELLHALGLRFTVSASRGMGAINGSGRGANDSSGGKGAPPNLRTRGDSSQLNPREKASRPPARS